MSDCLLLNADAQPVSLVPLSAIDWQSAIRYIWLDKVKVLHEYEDREIHSPSRTMKIPAVIMLNEYWQPKNRVRFNRKWYSYVIITHANIVLKNSQYENVLLIMLFPYQKVVRVLGIMLLLLVMLVTIQKETR